jgi:succinate dehydrogenase/fumarate reductase flavoprotein subunit
LASFEPRTELEEALDDLKSFKERAMACSSGTSRKYNSGWHQALDLINMVDVSHAATLAASHVKRAEAATPETISLRQKIE